MSPSTNQTTVEHPIFKIYRHEHVSNYSDFVIHLLENPNQEIYNPDVLHSLIWEHSKFRIFGLRTLRPQWLRFNQALQNCQLRWGGLSSDDLTCWLCTMGKLPDLCVSLFLHFEKREGVSHVCYEAWKGIQVFYPWPCNFLLKCVLNDKIWNTVKGCLVTSTWL